MAIKGSLARDESAPRDDTDEAERRQFSVHAPRNDDCRGNHRVLAAVAMLSYAHFTKKSQSVEADIAVAEVARLEEVYFSSTGTYSSDLDAIGFKLNPPVHYYQISVQAVNGPDDSMCQVTANPLLAAMLVKHGL